MKGINLARTTRSPMNKPMSSPLIKVTLTVTRGFAPETANLAPTTEQRAMAEPIDKSMPAEMIIKVIPIAAIPITTVC